MRESSSQPAQSKAAAALLAALGSTGIRVPLAQRGIMSAAGTGQGGGLTEQLEVLQHSDCACFMACSALILHW